LKQEVLMELPDQIEEYCAYKQLKVEDIMTMGKLNNSLGSIKL